MIIYIAHMSDKEAGERMHWLTQQPALAAHTFRITESKEKQVYKEALKECDLVITDVGAQSTGQGVELGWAEQLGKHIFVVHQKDQRMPSSVTLVADDIAIYEDKEDLLKQVVTYLEM